MHLWWMNRSLCRCHYWDRILLGKRFHNFSYISGLSESKSGRILGAKEYIHKGQYFFYSLSCLFARPEIGSEIHIKWYNRSVLFKFLYHFYCGFSWFFTKSQCYAGCMKTCGRLIHIFRKLVYAYSFKAWIFSVIYYIRLSWICTVFVEIYSNSGIFVWIIYYIIVTDSIRSDSILYICTHLMWRKLCYNTGF